MSIGSYDLCDPPEELNGRAHGSLRPEQFRVSVMGQGILCAVQGGLCHTSAILSDLELLEGRY